MSTGLTQAIGDIVDSGEIPERVTNKLIYAATIEVLGQVNSIKDTQAVMQKNINNNASAIARLVEAQDKNPSLLWLLKNETMKTAAAILVPLIVVVLLVMKYPQIFKLIGIDIP